MLITYEDEYFIKKLFNVVFCRIGISLGFFLPKGFLGRVVERQPFGEYIIGYKILKHCHYHDRTSYFYSLNLFFILVILTFIKDNGVVND